MPILHLLIHHPTYLPPQRKLSHYFQKRSSQVLSLPLSWTNCLPHLDSSFPVSKMGILNLYWNIIQSDGEGQVELVDGKVFEKYKVLPWQHWIVIVVMMMRIMKKIKNIEDEEEKGDS